MSTAPNRYPECSRCAQLIADVMGERPADILEEMLRRTRILGTAARSVLSAAEDAKSQGFAIPGRLLWAVNNLSRALDEANTFKRDTPAECVVSTYLTLVRPSRSVQRRS